MDDWRGRDLLSSVHEVCRLHWRKRGQPDVQIEELETAGLAYLRISYTHGPWTKHEVLGVFDGEPDEPALRRLRSLAGTADAELIFRGAKPTEPMCELARNSRIWLRGFEEYQSGLWDPKPYLRTQNTWLTGDPEYPLALHVDKRWAMLGAAGPAEQTALPAIQSWLAAPGPAFVLVLGDFGSGKTFLLRTIAHELAARDGLIPVLITMRDLEKGRTLDELLAQHMARHDEDPFHGSAFRYLLREGRIALLFDGFDELALRTSYERVPQHFATLREAAAGAAKVVVTSRHQYFATDQSIRNSLGDDVHRLPGSRIIRLAPLESAQRRELVVRTFDDNRAADEFMEALRDVPNLLDLATNPRMLAFIIRWYREGILTRAALAQSADRQMTAGTLYELLLTRWLSHEVARQTAIGGLKPLSVEQRMDALTETAMRMWRTGRRSLALDDLGEIAERISDLARLEMRPGEAVQTVGSSTVLVRTADNEFAFIHQSVMEWFVAYVARQAISQGQADEVLANHELTSPMVDFMCDLAGPDIVIDWARDIAARDESPGPVAKANASLVLQRRSVQATAVNYAGQDLRGRDLTGQDLNDANLSGADLSGAVLPKAMRRANLRDAKLVGARLHQADLTDANLSRADLRQARLVGATLTGANLQDAKLDRAILIGAQLDPNALDTASVFGAAYGVTSLVPQVAASSPAVSIASLPDSDLVVAGHSDGAITISDVTTGQVLRVLTGHSSAVLGVVVFSDGRLLASGSTDGTILIWDTSSCQLVTTLKIGSEVLTAIAASSMANWVAAGWGDGTIQLWQTTSGIPVRTLAMHSGLVTSIAVDPSGDVLTTANVDAVSRWNITTGELLETVPVSGGGSIEQLVHHPVNDVVWLRNLAGVTRLDQLPGQTHSTTGTPDTMTIDPSGAWLLIVLPDGIVQIGDGESVSRELSHPTAREITAAAMGSGGDWVAFVDSAGRIGAWETHSGRDLCLIRPTQANVGSITIDQKRASWLAHTGSLSSTTWQLTSGHAARSTEWLLTLSAASGHVVSIGNYHISVRADSGEQVLQRELTGFTQQAAVDPTGRWIVLNAQHSPRETQTGFDTVVHTLDTHSGRIVRSQSLPGGVRDVVVDPMGKWLATSSADGVDVWRMETKWFRLGGSPKRLVTRPDVRAMAVCPGEPWLIVATDTEISLWDTGSWQRLPITGGAGLAPISVVTKSAGNGWLASAHPDGTIHVWRLTGQNPDLQFSAGWTTALAMAPDGSWLASASHNGAVRLWDRETGAVKATLFSSESGSAAWMPDGRFKVHEEPAGLWWATGLCRFNADDLAELEPYLPGMRRVPEEVPLDLIG
jgi:WD40 repeat protein